MLAAAAIRTLPALVPGMDYARTIQGREPGGIPGTGFLASDVLSATVSAGADTPALVTAAVEWFDPASCQFLLHLGALQSAMLATDCVYYVLVAATRGPNTWPLAALYLPTLPAPGTRGPAAPPDLCTLPYACRMLAQLPLSGAQFEAIPDLITAASDLIRRWCHRRFDRGIITEEVTVEKNDTVRLSRPPIHSIRRVQDTPRRALTISNGRADAAWINALAGGDPTTGAVLLGLVLNWESMGIEFARPIAFAGLADQRIGTLAAAVAAVGAGWSAEPDPEFAGRPATQLMDILGSMGAADDEGGASLHVYARDVQATYFLEGGQHGGMVRIQRPGARGADPTWGPDWPMWSPDVGGPWARGPVRVTYDGGFTEVPPAVQQATAILVQSRIYRLATDFTLKSEHADKYSYELNPQMIYALPPDVLGQLSLYRLPYA